MIRPARSTTMAAWSRHLGQRGLVVGQVAVSVVLLAGAAVLIRGFVRLIAVDTGFDSTNVTLTRMPLPPDRFDTREKIDGFYGALLDRIGAAPGIEAAALGTAPPMAGANDTAVYREGQRPASAKDRRFAQLRWIQGDYFRTLGIPLVAGRLFDDRIDRPGGPDVAIISRQTAREFFAGENPLGQHLAIDLGDTIMATIVGVTADVRVFGQATRAPALVYLHARQHPAPFMQLIVRSAVPASEVAATVRRHVSALDSALAPSRIERLDALLADSVAQPRFSMLLIGTLAALALLLTTVGLYGTLSYLVARREREFGIRLAVGASVRDIRRMVLRQGGMLVAIGLAGGVVAALFTSRAAASLISGLGSADPIVLGGVAALMAATSFAAVLVPAIRATRVEPIVALRGE
jgi:putative ABC transport system permease protein